MAGNVYACRGYGHIAIDCPSSRGRVEPDRVQFLKRKLVEREAEISDLKELKREEPETEEESIARLEKKYRVQTVAETSREKETIGDASVAKTPAVCESLGERVKKRNRGKKQREAEQKDDESDSGSESDSSNSDSSSSSSSSCGSGKNQQPQVAGNVFIVGNEVVVPKLVNPGDIMTKHGIILELDTTPETTEWHVIPKKRTENIFLYIYKVLIKLCFSCNVMSVE